MAARDPEPVRDFADPDFAEPDFAEPDFAEPAGFAAVDLPWGEFPAFALPAFALAEPDVDGAASADPEASPPVASTAADPAESPAPRPALPLGEPATGLALAASGLPCEEPFPLGTPVAAPDFAREDPRFRGPSPERVAGFPLPDS